MNQRRRRQKFNSVDAPALARWVVLFIFVAATGLSYVYLSVQLHSVANQRKKLEHDGVELRTQIKNAQVQIAALTSYTALERRLREGYLQMVPITSDKIVQLNPPTRPLDENPAQPIAQNQPTDR